MRRMHTDQEITNLVENNPSVKNALALATETAETYKAAELVLNSGDFDAVFDAKNTPYETSDPEEPDVINALYNADIIIVYSDGPSGTAKEDPHFFRKMRESNYEETAYFECFEMDTGKLYHYEMSVSVPEEGGEITINPLKTFEPLLSDIVDADGHKRFQEWDLTPASSAGLTLTYAKASLSGTHFMMVIAGDVENGAVIGNGQTLASINNLPDWILSKIFPIWGDVWVERKETNAYASDWTTQTFVCGLNKSSNFLAIGKLGAITLTADRKFRIQFDLLID